MSDALAGIARGMIARCEALEDEAYTHLEKPLTDHEYGFWRGQRLTAKSLRREFADLSRAYLEQVQQIGEKS